MRGTARARSSAMTTLRTQAFLTLTAPPPPPSPWLPGSLPITPGSWGPGGPSSLWVFPPRWGSLEAPPFAPSVYDRAHSSCFTVPCSPPPYDAKGAGRKTGTAAPSQSGVSAHRLFSHSQPPPNVGAWGPGLGCSVRNTSQIMREISQQSRETWSISLMERTGPTPDGSPVCPL